MHQFTQNAICFKRFRAAAQNAGVAGFDGKTGRVHRHVWTRLIDDSENAKRHSHASDLNARGATAHLGNFTDGVGKGRSLSGALSHQPQHFFRDAQAIHERFFQSVFLCSDEIMFVGCKYGLFLSFQQFGQTKKGLVLVGS